MGIIELAKNPGSLKDNIGQVQYNKLPGATAQDKLINYLNSRLTAYDRFYNANKDADSLPQEMRNKVKDSYSKLQSELKDLYYLTSLKRFVNPEDRPGFWEATGEKFAKEFLAGGLDFTDNAQMHSENLQTIAKNAGISFSDKDKSYIETTAAPADAYSPEWWGDNFGSTLGFGANIAVSAPIGNTSLKIGEGIVKATPMFKKIAEYGLKRYSKLGGTGQKITNTIFNSLDEGYNFEMANQLIYDGESDELTFLTGVGGAIAAAPVNKLLSKTGKLIFGKADDVTEAVAGKAYTKEEAAVLEVLGAQRDDVRMALQGLTKENGVDDYVYMLQGTFGNKAPEAIKQIQKVGSVLIARPTGEVTQEMGEELTSIYRQSDSFEAFKQEFSKRFPDADAMTQFVVASYVMGLGFGAGNYVGDVFTAQSKKSFDQLPPDQQEIAAEAIREATEDINKADTETINEIELDEASRPKTKEEEEWSAKEGEIKQGIDSNTKRINELDGLKNQIYSNYNITDPKTEDISNISEEDARRLEILNSEIDKADKARIKDEIELELHNKNKPAVEQAPVNAIHAKDLKKEEAPVEKTQEQTEVDNLNDDEEYTFSYIGEDKIPSFLKGIAEKTKNKATVKRGLFGKTENFQFYQVKATGKQIKDLYYAVQEPSTEEVLPRQQGTTTETGGEPQGMGQGVQGEKAPQEGQEISQENELDPDLANIDPLIIAARNGDVDAQNTLNEYGLDWEQTTTYRFVGNSEVETLLSNNRVESKRFVDAGIDVTTSPKVTSASNSEYRITFKESFDVNNGLGKVKVKSREEGDHNLEKGRGYSLEDVAKIERLDENGNVVETLYDAKQKSLEGNQEATQEGVTTLNQESFSEDVTPEQKAKVEEQNQKDEDESINEIYDFNDEIKSVGTKEQFKQFLRSLAPKSAFSRIAWHNTKKPELTPREGQYYTNTRKNAEDTYKQDNTFAAIVFGNAPKKASFDEVQQVDTKAVKGEGADIVITDDLSPAIGADMNYREFVPTSADQVIPIGTKENIEAFKAFVEQQKAPEVAKPATEQKVEPEAQEVTGEMSMKDKEAANRKKIIEHNQKAKENRGTNVKAKDFKTVKKRGQDLKVGDIYLRKINDAVYVFRVLSKLNKSNGQFYNMKVEVLDTGTDYVRQELDPQFNIREFGKKVGEETIDTFKNLSSPYGLNFGEVTVIENFESKKKTEEKAPEVQAAEEVAVEDKSIIDAVETLANAEEAGGSEITKAQKEVAEKLGEEGKKLVEINRNFDKLADDLGFIKTCIIE
jgi:hypothetical protein